MSSALWGIPFAQLKERVGLLATPPSHWREVSRYRDRKGSGQWKREEWRRVRQSLLEYNELEQAKIVENERLQDGIKILWKTRWHILQHRFAHLPFFRFLPLYDKRH